MSNARSNPSASSTRGVPNCSTRKREFKAAGLWEPAQIGAMLLGENASVASTNARRSRSNGRLASVMEASRCESRRQSNANRELRRADVPARRLPTNVNPSTELKSRPTQTIRPQPKSLAPRCLLVVDRDAQGNLALKDSRALPVRGPAPRRRHHGSTAFLLANRPIV